MSTHDHSHRTFNYSQMMENALVSVLRTALQKTAAEGLPGEHHFYITFRTRAPGVAIPEFLKTTHPDTMTVVLQHSFENLEVTEERFSVDLSFQGRWQKVVVPFAAVKAFADPHAHFGLQFGIDQDDSVPNDDDVDLDSLFEDYEEIGVLSVDEKDEESAGATVVPFDRFRKR